MGSNSEENVKFEYIIDCCVSEQLFRCQSFVCRSLWTLSNVLAQHLCGLFGLRAKQALTFWNRGVEFDDEELSYHEEDKPAIKVGKDIQLRFLSTMFP